MPTQQIQVSMAQQHSAVWSSHSILLQRELQQFPTLVNPSLQNSQFASRHDEQQVFKKSQQSALPLLQQLSLQKGPSQLPGLQLQSPPQNGQQQQQVEDCTIIIDIYYEYIISGKNVTETSWFGTIKVTDSITYGAIIFRFGHKPSSYALAIMCQHALHAGSKNRKGIKVLAI